MQGYGEKELINKVKPFRLNCQVNCFLKGVVQLPDFFFALLSLHSAQFHFLSSDTCRFLCCTDSTSQERKTSTSYPFVAEIVFINSRIWGGRKPVHSRSFSSFSSSALHLSHKFPWGDRLCCQNSTTHSREKNEVLNVIQIKAADKFLPPGKCT